MKRVFSILFAVCVVGAVTTSVAADSNYKIHSANFSNRIQCFTKKYPGYIRFVKSAPHSPDVYLEMKNGEDILWNNGQKHGLIETVMQTYPVNAPIDQRPDVGQDPGRLHDNPFFKNVYGDSKSSVQLHLVQVPWMPNTLHVQEKTLLFNYLNGAAAALERVSKELDVLPLAMRKYVTGIKSTYEWQPQSDNGGLSSSSYGIVVTLDPQYQNTWKEAPKDKEGNIEFKNQIPADIVKIFEKNGFIWGGRWYHYDTTHFEYRPEFFYQACATPVK